jgi:hypothetical protein
MSFIILKRVCPIVSFILSLIWFVTLKHCPLESVKFHHHTHENLFLVSMKAQLGFSTPLFLLTFVVVVVSNITVGLSSRPLSNLARLYPCFTLTEQLKKLMTLSFHFTLFGVSYYMLSLSSLVLINQVVRSKLWAAQPLLCGICSYDYMTAN